MQRRDTCGGTAARGRAPDEEEATGRSPGGPGGVATTPAAVACHGDAESRPEPASDELHARARAISPVMTVALYTLTLRCRVDKKINEKKTLPNGEKKPLYVTSLYER